MSLSKLRTTCVKSEPNVNLKEVRFADVPTSGVLKMRTHSEGGSQYLAQGGEDAELYRLADIKVPRPRNRPRFTNAEVLSLKYFKKALAKDIARKRDSKFSFCAHGAAVSVNADNVLPVVEHLASSMENVAKSLESVKVNHSFDWWSSLKDIDQETLLVIAILVGGSAGFMWATRGGELYGFMTLLCSSYVLYRTGKNLFSGINLVQGDLSFDDDHFKAQSGDIIMDGIMASLYYFIFREASATSNIPKMLTSLGNMPRATLGMKDMLDWLLLKLQSFIDWFFPKIGQDPWLVGEEPYPGMRDLQLSIGKIVQEVTLGKAVDFQMGQKIIELHDKCRRLLLTIPLSNVVYRNAIMAEERSLRPVMDALRRSNITGNGPRPRPLAVLVSGPSQVGKSKSVVPLTYMLLAEVLPVDQLDAFRACPNSFMYNRVHETDFWDAMNRQPVCFFDDIGQQRESIGANSEFLECIRCINEQNYMLHKASLEDKGSCNFHSPMVLATTNIRAFNSGNIQSIREPEAFARRWDVSVICVPKLEFCVEDADAKGTDEVSLFRRRLDVDKLDAHLATLPADERGFSPDVSEFYTFDAFTGRTKGQRWDFYSFLRHLVEQWKIKENKGKMQTLQYSSLVEKCLRRRTDYVCQSGDTKPLDEYGINYRIVSDFITNNCDNKCCSQFTMSSLDFLLEQERLLSIESLVARLADKIVNKEFCCNIALIDYCDEIKYLWPMELVQYVGRVKNSISFWGLEVCAYFKNMILGIEASTVIILLTTVMTASSVMNTLANVNPIVRRTKAKPCVKVLAQSRAKARALTRRMQGPSRSGSRFSSSTHMSSSGDVVAQGAHTVSFGHRIWRHNTYRIKAGSNRKWCGVCVFITDRIAMMPSHFVHGILDLKEDGFYDKGESVVLERCGSNVIFRIPVDVFDEHKVLFIDPFDSCLMCGEESCSCPIEWDVCFVRFPDWLPNHKDLLKYFTNVLLSKPNKSVIDIAYVKDSSECPTIVCREARLITAVDSSGSEPAVDEIYQYPMANGGANGMHFYSYITIRTQMVSALGDCGAILLSDDKASSSPFIYGFHVAGSNNDSLAVYVSKSMVDQAFHFFNEQRPLIIDSVAHDTIVANCGDSFMRPSLMLFPIKPHTVAMKSKLEKSEFYGAFGQNILIPAKLRDFKNADGDIISPNTIAHNKYYFGVPEMHMEGLDVATRLCWAGLNDGFPNRNPPTVFSYEEAVLGRSDLDFFRALPRSTSAGYPWCLTKGKPGKKRFFGDGMEYDLGTPEATELKNLVNTLISDMKRGIRPKFVYADFLKDELRPVEKSKAGKTRLISACPVEYMIITRMYFMDFCRWLCINRIANGVAVGINPYSSDWQHLYSHMTSVGDNCIAGDFSNYDGSLNPCVMSKFMDVVEWFYFNSTDEDVLVRRILFTDIINSRHSDVGFCWEWMGCVPSGTGLTTFVNSISNVILLWYNILNVHYGFKDVKSSDVFDEARSNVSIITYGDDNGVSLSNKFKDVTPLKLSESFKRIGMTYTNETKGSMEDAFRRWRDCSFLKRGFRYEHKISRWVAPLDINTILYSIYWCNKSATNEEIFFSFQALYYELALHSEEVFNEYAPKFRSTLHTMLGRNFQVCDRKNIIELVCTQVMALPGAIVNDDILGVEL